MVARIPAVRHPDTVSRSVPRRDGRTTDTRERIIEVAIATFIERGYSATTLQEIADRLGLTKAALYYHFSSKDELVRAVMQPLLDDMHAFVEIAAEADLTPRRLLSAYVDTVLGNRDRCMALGRDPSLIAAVIDDDWVEFWIEPIQRRLLRADPDPEVRIRSIAAISALGRSFLLTDVPTEEIRDVAVDVALETLGIDAAAADRPIPAGGLVP